MLRIRLTFEISCEARRGYSDGGREACSASLLNTGRKGAGLAGAPRLRPADTPRTAYQPPLQGANFAGASPVTGTPGADRQLHLIVRRCLTDVTSPPALTLRLSPVVSAAISHYACYQDAHVQPVRGSPRPSSCGRSSLDLDRTHQDSSSDSMVPLPRRHRLDCASYPDCSHRPVLSE